MLNDASTLLVVCDAGPLIHLDQLDCLDLLADFSRIVVPDVVWSEVEHHRPAALEQKTILLERLMPREEPSPELIAAHRLVVLHVGEAQALQLAQELNADLLLTDDTAARLAARTAPSVCSRHTGSNVTCYTQRTTNTGRDSQCVACAASSFDDACKT